jgi:hypothetical protein
VYPRAQALGLMFVVLSEFQQAASKFSFEYFTGKLGEFPMPAFGGSRQ